MRRIGLIVGITSSVAWLWLMQRPEEPASSFLALASAGIMAATLLVSWWWRRPPAASSAMKVTSVVMLCAGAAAATVRARAGLDGQLVALLLLASAVPLGVVFKLRSRDQVNWPPRLVALVVALGALGVAWGTMTAQRSLVGARTAVREMRTGDPLLHERRLTQTSCYFGGDKY